MSHDFGSCYCHKRYSRRECSLIDGLYVSNFDLDWKYDGLIEIEKIYTEKIMEKKKECKFHIHPPFKDLKLKAYGITATPLIFACLNGNLDMVKRVVEVWGANINQIGDIVTSSFESSFERMERITHMIDCLTPLFAAALKKKKDIVCYLLGKGAIISHITRSNLFGTDGLTPLHAAFYLEKPESDESPDNQNEIIRILVASGAGPSGLSSKGVPIWMTGWECSRDLFGELYGPDPGWCNTNGIKTLIQLGMNPNGRGKYGRTLLHHLTGLANFKDNVEIVKFLLENGAARDLQSLDEDGLTPIMHAAIGSYRPRAKKMVTNINILKYLMEREDINRMEKIDALELAAAVLLSYYPTNPEYLDDIIYFLTQSRILRQLENRPLIINRPSNGRDVEWITSAPAEEIKERIVEECELQSILIRLRIFSSFGWRAVNRYLDDWSFFQFYRKPQHSLVQGLHLSWAVLEYVLQEYSDERKFRLLQGNNIHRLVDTLKALKKTDNPHFNIESIKTSMDLVIATYRKPLHKFQDTNFTESYLNYLVNLISMLADLPNICMNENIMEALRRIFSENVLGDDRKSLIHKACEEETINNLFATVRLLLRVGADPNDIDDDGNGPLHFLARRKEASLVENEQVNLTARLLLDAGTHLDLVNKRNRTAANNWIIKEEEKIRKRLVDAIAWIDLPDWLKEDVPKLSCLSARIIRCNGVPYLRKLPFSLCRLVQMHSKDGTAIPISRLIEKLNQR